MKWRLSVGGLFFLIGFGLIWLNQQTQSTQAALYWNNGVHDGPEISVCFAGNAVSKRPDRVREVITHMLNFEHVANIRFVTLANTRAKDEILPSGNLDELACPLPVWTGFVHLYDGDIRIALNNTDVPVDPPGMVPGTGCTQAREPNSWANPPSDLELKRSCQYNLRLGDDRDNLRTGIPNPTPWLNHALHEVGHALGLGHEHARNDENAQCVPSSHGDWHTATTGFMTPYDKDSVMHYQFDFASTPACNQIGSNYSDSNFTAYDKLALHILYPEDGFVAEFVGTTVIPSSELLSLQSAWYARGAKTDFVVNSFLWEIDGQQFTGPTLEIDLGVGEYVLQFSYQDFLGRDYYYSGPVRVLSDDDFNAQIVAPILTNLPNIYPNYYYNFNADLALQPDQNVEFFFPAGLFAQDVVIDYARQPNVDVGMQSIGLFYDIEATVLDSGLPAQIEVGQQYSVTITYENTAVSSLANESDLALYYWDNTQWVRETTSQVDVAANRLTATPNHFSSWAVLAPNSVYLPFVKR